MDSIKELADIINELNYYETSVLINNLSHEKLSHLSNGCEIKLKWVIKQGLEQ